MSILQEQIGGTFALLEPLTPEQAKHAYASGKWTVKEVVGHLADTERVMSYRALRIARSDPAGLAGFEEDDWVSTADFGRHALDQVLAELIAARRSTVALFGGFAPGAWTRRGVANQQEVSVRALACIIAGHELHHRAILRERYGIGRQES